MKLETFRPQNRNITVLIPMDDPDGITTNAWFATDWDSNHTIWSWGCSALTLRVMSHYTTKLVFIVCTDRGAYLKHPTRSYESKGRTRYFKTAAEAAKFAEEQG